MNGSDEQKEKHGFLNAGTDFCEVHLNPFQYNAEAMAGLHECSRKPSRSLQRWKMAQNVPSQQ